MPSPTPVTAVFDIGKTNKKFLLFDDKYSIVHKRQMSLEETVDEDGYPCEDLPRLEEWLETVFREASENPDFKITALNFSTYGASLVHLDDKGEVVAPLYNYLKPFPEDLANAVYKKYGGREHFVLQTASPPMGMLNSGLQLYWLKHKKPDLFRKIRHSLHFPQYLSFLFTGRYAAELTSIGCHTGMWNFKDNNYHRWLEEEDILALLPEIQPVSTVAQVTYLENRLHAGVGIHDSSAALAPYLFAMEKPFIQLSTGTWSISLNPFTTDPLTYEELAKDCLLYMNIYGEPVKASRLFLGSEYSHQKKKLERHSGLDQHADVEPDPVLLEKLVNLNRPEIKLQLETAHTSGPYPSEKPGNWDISCFDTYTEAYHQLMIDLVSIQADSLKLAQGSDETDQIIITGGFSKNDFFARMLASFFPQKNIYTAVTSHASALGAALVMREKDTDSELLKDILGLKLHKPIGNVHIKEYSWADNH